MKASPEPTRGGVIAWFASNSVAANVFMVALMVGGLLTISRTSSDLFPEIDPRTLTVSVVYAGATPEEIASSVTSRAEQAVQGLQGIERVRSVAVEGMGTLTIELDDFADAQTVADEVRSAIDSLVSFPPEGAEDPQISVTSIASNVIRLTVTGSVGEVALRRAAEELERSLLLLDEVSSVTLQGARSYEISIEVSQASLSKYGLTIDKIANAIRGASVNLSGGTLRTSAGNILLRTNEEVKEAADYGNIVVLSDFEGRRLLLQDIASIQDGFQDVPLINSYNDQPAVFLQVARGKREDSITVANTVKAFLETYAPPPGVQVLVVGDQTEVIRDRINLLMRNAIMGLALVFGFLALTLDLRLAFWTCVGIPVTFLGGFIIFGQFTNINMTMLLGLIMVLGLVVDDAIVVGESIYDEQEKGDPGLRSAIRGTRKVAVPVVVGVMTTIGIFAPLLFSSGMLGQLIRPVPMVAVSVLIISLLEVFLILPAHMSHGSNWTAGPMQRLKEFTQRSLFYLRDKVILPLVRLTIRMPYLIIASAISLLLVTMGIVLGGHVRFVFFPVVEGEEIRVKLTMPNGTSFEQTEEKMNRVVEGAYRALGGKDSALYRSISVTIGGELVSGFGVEGTQISSEIATATLELAPAGQRDLSAAEIERDWRAAIGGLAGFRSLVFASEGLSGGDDISFNLSHQNEETLALAVEELRAALQTMEGVAEVESTRELGSRQLQFSLLPTGTAAGLTVNELAKQVRQSFYGEEVQRIQRASEEVIVYVRLPERERRSLADLARLRIALPNGEEADLRTVAEVVETRSAATIERIDGRQFIGVSADVDEAVTTPTTVTQLLKTEMLPALRDRYPGLYITEEGQSRDQAKDLVVLISNLMIGVLIMYILLSSQLRSYLQPLIILFVIPFGAVGAVVGHSLLGFDLTFLSLFGMVALAGVVVNDSIVLIDYFNQLNQSGQGTTADNILEAVERRFRPIFITTATTFLGLFPMITETSLQARFLIPMAISVAFGILVATSMILLIVPACLATGFGVAKQDPHK